jgi:RNA polymerase sigma-70 factor (ECF subfamily)
MGQAEVVRPLGFQSDALLLASAGGHPAAFGVLFERHRAYVTRVLARILGTDADLPDLTNEVFLVVHRRLGAGLDGERFRAWLTGLCVNVARNRLRTRRRRRWLIFTEPTEAEQPHVVGDADAREALTATYEVLSTMDENLRICFALRFIDGQELTEIAEACDVSLATIKRWLARAERVFVERARGQPALSEWLDGGSRWGASA